MNEVELELELVHETDKAYLVSDGTQEVWVSKSQVDYNNEGIFLMPEWLALEKGLI